MYKYINLSSNDFEKGKAGFLSLTLLAFEVGEFMGMGGCPVPCGLLSDQMQFQTAPLAVLTIKECLQPAYGAAWSLLRATVVKAGTPEEQVLETV